MAQSLGRPGLQAKPDEDEADGEHDSEAGRTRRRGSVAQVCRAGAVEGSHVVGTAPPQALLVVGLVVLQKAAAAHNSGLAVHWNRMFFFSRKICLYTFHSW